MTDLTERLRGGETNVVPLSIPDTTLETLTRCSRAAISERPTNWSTIAPARKALGGGDE